MGPLLQNLSQVRGNLFKWLGRFFLITSNFFFSLRNLTLRSSLGLFLVGRSFQKMGFLKLREGKGRFRYRGCADFSVLDHFYKQGCRIEAPEPAAIQRILDLGANIGDETVKFAIRFPQAKIVALEPDEENYRILAHNCRPYRNIDCRREAVWPESADLRVLKDGSTPLGHRVEVLPPTESGDAGVDQVKGVTIPFLLATYGWQEVDILKIDIEGADFPLFAEATDSWLPRIRSLIIEVSDSDRQGSFQNFFRAFDRLQLRFRFQIVGENLVGIREGLPWKVRVVRSIHSPTTT